MLYYLIGYLVLIILYCISVSLAHKQGYEKGWWAGYEKAKDEDFNVVFGVKEKSNQTII